MRSLSCLTVLAISFSSAVLAHVPPSPTEEPGTDVRQDFQDLINALPEESLQAALHGHIPHFKDGIFESSRHGVEKVHERNPRLASKLIVAAVQDLKKRQTPSDGNSTVTGASDTGTPSQTPTLPPSSSDDSTPSATPTATPSDTESGTATATPSATVVPSSNTPTETSQRASEPPEPTTTFTPTASAVIRITTTNSKGSTVTSKETLPAVVITTTNSAGKTVKTTSAVKDEPMEIKTTNAQGSTFVTTVTPTVGKVSSIVLVTTQGPNGEQITRTSYTYVTPAEATGQEGEQPSGTSVRPGLQTGAAVPAGAVGAGLWGVAGMVALMI